MGCITTRYLTVEKELAGVRDLSGAQKEALDELNKVRAANYTHIAKLQEDNRKEIYELHQKMSSLIQETTEEHRKMQESHVHDLRNLHEKQAKEVRRLQEEHHESISGELMRHFSETRRIQVEYRSHLRGLGMDLGSALNPSRCCGPYALAPKDIILASDIPPGPAPMMKSAHA